MLPHLALIFTDVTFSPWTRTGDRPVFPGVDRGRKLADYRLGGAGLYVLVDLPAGTPSAEATFEAHDFAAERVTAATGAIALVIGDRPLQFDLR